MAKKSRRGVILDQKIVEEEEDSLGEDGLGQIPPLLRLMQRDDDESRESDPNSRGAYIWTPSPW